MPSPATVTVAVVSWNTRDLLAACLRSLWPDAQEGRAEVVVVDNGSTDGSAELVEEGFRWARLVRAGSNLGYERAVNRAARDSRTPWIPPARTSESSPRRSRPWSKRERGTRRPASSPRC